MHIAIVGCPFRTSYGAYIESLKHAIERKGGSDVQWVGSNCGCGDPIERNRVFQTTSCKYFEARHIGDYSSAKPWKEALRLGARNALYYFRAAKYAELSQDADVAHFQQILNAFGSDVVFHWLRRKSSAARVVTVHELDKEQNAYPDRNRTYNRADAIIVHADELKKKMVGLGVEPGLIHIVRYGVDIPSVRPTGQRDGIVFYAGHKVMSGKGIETLIEAMAILSKRLGARTPRLRIHGHYGTNVPNEAQELAERAGVADRIDWLNQISMKDIETLYRSSIACVLPYSGSFAGLPVAVAAANELPIIATRHAGIPEHIGENGIWIGGKDPVEIADRIADLLSNEARGKELGLHLRRRAEEYLSWDIVAAETLKVFEAARVHHARA